jgi:hypothetical protein
MVFTKEELSAIQKALLVSADYFEDKLRHGELGDPAEIIEYDACKSALNKLVTGPTLEIA